jgi:hypothetical protein
MSNWVAWMMIGFEDSIWWEGLQIARFKEHKDVYCEGCKNNQTN